MKSKIFTMLLIGCLCVAAVGCGKKADNISAEAEVVSVAEDATANSEESTVDTAQNDKETEMRNQLISDVSQLNDYMKQIQNYKHNLEQLSVNVPELPEEINGDSFSNDETLNNDYTEKASADENTEAALVYSPSYIFAGGRNFDWFHKTHVNDCFVSSDSDDVDTYEGISTDGWTMLDGSTIDFEQIGQSNMDNLKAIHDNIQGYVDAVNAYGQLKFQYQTIDIQEYYRFLYMG